VRERARRRRVDPWWNACVRWAGRLGLRPDEVDPIEAYACELALLSEEAWDVQTKPQFLADAENPVLTGDPWLDARELAIHAAADEEG